MKEDLSRHKLLMKGAFFHSWWLYFEDPKTEREYEEHIANINAVIAKTAGNILAFIGLIYISIVLISNMSRLDDLPLRMGPAC